MDCSQEILASSIYAAPFSLGAGSLIQTRQCSFATYLTRQLLEGVLLHPSCRLHFALRAANLSTRPHRIHFCPNAFYNFNNIFSSASTLLCQLPI